MARIDRWLATLVLVVAASAAHAATRFDALPAEERRVLAPFEDTWDTLSDDTQSKLREGARRWQSMDAEQRRGAAERFAQWQRLPPPRRAELRRRYDAFRALPPERQLRLRRAWQRFRALPPAERAELRQRWQSMSPAERRAFAAGAEAGARARGGGARMRAEREESRAMFEALTPERQRVLRAHMASLSRPARQTLRRELLALDPAARDARIDALAR